MKQQQTTKSEIHDIALVCLWMAHKYQQKKLGEKGGDVRAVSYLFGLDEQLMALIEIDVRSLLMPPPQCSL
jgi:hypothetical protein